MTGVEILKHELRKVHEEERVLARNIPAGPGAFDALSAKAREAGLLERIIKLEQMIDIAEAHLEKVQELAEAACEIFGRR